jgi:hypothetical protein
VERNRRGCTRLSGSVGRLLSLAVLCTAVTWWLAAAIARADTPPSNDGAPPAISGTAQEGHVLTASAGDWTGDAPITFAYAWSDGQSGPSIKLSAADVGQTLTVTVTGSNDFGQSSATSAGVGPVLPAPPAPGSPPVISGTPQQGHTLSVSNGTWSGDPTGFSYVWEDCDRSGANCNAITGASSSTYTLEPSDVGSTIVASVTATNAGGSGSATSASVGPVLPGAPALATVLPGAPALANAPGHTLTVSTGTWRNNPTKFTYAWQDCDVAGNDCSSVGTSSNSYTLQGSDVNRYVSVTVTASNAGGSATVTTASVGPVLLPIRTTVLGTITATMQWAFHFTPKYTLVQNLVVNGAPRGATVIVRCHGLGCPFTKRTTTLTKGKRCVRKAKRACVTPGTLTLTPSFAGRQLGVGARITVSIVRPGWIGKSYRFTVRARRGPRVQIGSLPVS